MTDAKPIVRVTRYEVSCLPEGHDDADVFTIKVEYRGAGRWAVTRNGAHYDADGGRSWGPRWPKDGPEREAVTAAEFAEENRVRDDWLAAHRFDRETALEIATRVAPKITVNGWTVDQVLTRAAS